MLKVRAVPVLQTSSTSILYDAVMVGTDNIIEFMPATTGLQTPISTFINVAIATCHSGEICIEKVYTDSASNVASSVAAQFSVLPTSISNALEDIVEAIEAGFQAGKTANSSTGALSTLLASSSTGQGNKSRGVTSNPENQYLAPYSSTSRSTTHGSSSSRLSASTNLSDRLTGSTGRANHDSATLSKVSTSSGSATTSFIFKGTGATTSAGNVSTAYRVLISTDEGVPTATNSSSTTDQGLGGSNRTRSLAAATLPPNSLVTSASDASNSQGYTTKKPIRLELNSSTPNTGISFTYADNITITVASIPDGVSIQALTTSTCTTAGAIVTKTSSVTTVATEVPELCTHGLAFLIFGLPGFHSSSDLASLCRKSFKIPLGIVWRLLCPTIGPPTFSITSVDAGALPPGGGPPGENPNDGNPDDDNTTPTQKPSQAQSTTRSMSQTSTQTMTQSTTQTMTQSTTQTTQSTASSSSSRATPTRYVVMPLIGTLSRRSNLCSPHILDEKTLL